MNIQLQAKTFTSAADIFADAAARRRRFEKAGLNPRPKPVSAPTVVRTVSAKRPEWMVVGSLFDAHVQQWRKRLGNPGKAHLQDRCREIGISYRTIIGPCRSYPVVAARQLIMWEIWIMFDFSFPRLGELFGGRDHTTCLHGVRKMQSKFGSQRIPA